MKTNIQDVFNKALPFYTTNFTGGFCLCLSKAFDEGLITLVEMTDAHHEIETYIQELNTLSNQTISDVYLSRALEGANLPHEYEDRLAIYKDWENRPRLSNRE